MPHSNIIREIYSKKPFWGVREKLIVSFSLIVTAILVVVGLLDIVGIPFTPYIGRLDHQREETFRSLNLIADLKKERLLRWLEELHDDVHLAATNEFTTTSVEQILEMMAALRANGQTGDELWTSIQAEKEYQALLDYLNTIQSTYNVYNKILIADVETGTVFVAAGETGPGADISQEAYFNEALKTGHKYVSDIELDPQTQQPVLYFGHTIENEAGIALAVLALEVNTDDIVKPLLLTGEGLEEKGEALLVNRDGKILTSLKHPLPDGRIAEPLVYQIKAEPAQLAAGGQEGIIESEDYRGEAVLAAYRYLPVTPEWGWGMVVKRDQAELFAPLRQSIAYTSTIVLIGVLVMIGLTVAIANGLTRPILLLSETAGRVANGDLEAQAPVTTSDEVGILAKTFNAMIRRVRDWQEELEAQVEARTGELDRKNKALNAEIMVRHQAEAELEWELAVNASLSRLYKPLVSPFSSIKEITNTVFEQARLLTTSEHGYVSSIDPNTGDNIGHTLTEMLKDRCQVTGENKRITFPRGPDGYYGGLWGHSLNTRKPFYTNTPETHSSSVGLPQAHIPLQRFLSVPVLLGKELVGQIALANANRDYTGRDLEAIGRLAEFYAVAIQRLRIQEALRESEDRFRRLAENAQDIIYRIRLTPTQSYEYVSPAVTAITGYTPEDHYANPDLGSKLIYPMDRPRLEAYFEQGNMFDYPITLRWVRRDGKLVWVEQRNVPVYDETGALTAIEGVARDVTERRLAEETLQKSHAELNRRVEARTMELQMANEFLKREVAERKRTQEELRQAKEAAEVANRAKSEFLASMSHELRTPLNSILGYAQILKSDKTLAPSQIKEIDIIEQSGQHLLMLINDILDLSKIEAGRMELQPAEFYLPTFLQNIVDIFQVRADQQGIFFTYEHHALPAGVQADEKRLRQILINLLSNAIKFTEAGRVTLKVKGLGEPAEPGLYRVRFQVEDTGCGIPAEKLTEIFEPFRQVNHQSHFVEGTGLGLAISQSLAQMMGSDLQVESQVGQGSVFWLDVDLPESLAWPEAPTSEQIVVGFKGGPSKILLVDDRAENRTFLKDVLDPLGFEVIEAANGLEGLQKGLQEQPDLILVDLRMPEMDGFEMTKRLRQADALKHSVIIAVSASVFRNTRRESTAAGCDDFISKPVYIPQLLELIEQYLQVEWIYEESGPDPDVDKAGDYSQIIPPPAGEIAALHNLAMSGDIGGIMKEIAKIEQTGEQLRAFVTELRQLAENYEINKIREFIKHFEEK